MKILAQRIHTESDSGDETNAVLVTLMLYQNDINFCLDGYVNGEPISAEIAQSIASQLIEAIANIT